MRSKIISVFVLALALTSCKNNSPYDGYEQTETGLFYKLVKQTNSETKVKKGDFITVRVVNKLYPDSLLFDSKVSNPQGTIQLPVQEAKFKGSLEEGLLMMSEGDSASFLVSADSIDKHYGSSGVKHNPGAMLVFNVQVEKIRAKDEVMKEREAAMKKYQEEQMALAEKNKGAEPIELDNYLKTNKITTKPTASGLYFIETAKGKGPMVKQGQTVTIKYVGKFLDGTIFDASEKHGKDLEFQAAVGQVIKGWDEAVLKMQAGTKATLIIPSALAYGDGGGRFEPFKTLLFDVEVVSIK